MTTDTDNDTQSARRRAVSRWQTIATAKDSTSTNLRKETSLRHWSSHGCIMSKGYMHLSLTIHHTDPQTLTNECYRLILDIIYIGGTRTYLLC